MGPVLLGDVYIVNPDILHSSQVNGTPDTGIWKMRAPVPTKHAVRLAQVHEAGYGFSTAPDWLALIMGQTVSGG